MLLELMTVAMFDAQPIPTIDLPVLAPVITEYDVPSPYYAPLGYLDTPIVIVIPKSESDDEEESP